MMCGSEMTTSEATVRQRSVANVKGKETRSWNDTTTGAACAISESSGAFRLHEGAKALEYDARVIFDPPIAVTPNGQSDAEGQIEITSGRHSGTKYRVLWSTQNEWHTEALCRRLGAESGDPEA